MMKVLMMMDEDDDECVACVPTGQQWGEAVEQEMVRPH